MGRAGEGGIVVNGGMSQRVAVPMWVGGAVVRVFLGTEYQR